MESMWKDMDPMVSIQNVGRLWKRYGINLGNNMEYTKNMEYINLETYGIHEEKHGINMSSHCPWTKRPSTSK